MNAIIILITIGIVALFVAAGLFIGSKLGCKELPKAVWQQGIRNAFLTFLIVLAAGGVIALISILSFRQSTESGFSIAFTTIIVASFLYFLFYWLRNRRQAGKVLLDIRPYPNKTMTLVGAGLFILLGFLGSYSFFWRTSKYAWLASSIIGLSVGTVQIIAALSRLQARENGILAYTDLVKWDKIESFNWVDSDGKAYTLKLRYKGRLPAFLRNGAVPVPAEKKAEFESILERYLVAPSVSDAENYMG